MQLSDLSEMKITGGGIEFTKIPTQVIVRSSLSKARSKYFTFLGEEGCTYIKEYLNERVAAGEKLNESSPLLQLDVRGKKKNLFLRTVLVSRDVREGILGAGLKMRPYVMRAYFSTALDIAESKGVISHPWRQFLMGQRETSRQGIQQTKGCLLR